MLRPADVHLAAQEWLDAGNPFSDWVGNGGGNGSRRSRGRSRMPAMQLGFGGMSGCGDVPDRWGQPHLTPFPPHPHPHPLPTASMNRSKMRNALNVR